MSGENGISTWEIIWMILTSLSLKLLSRLLVLLTNCPHVPLFHPGLPLIFWTVVSEKTLESPLDCKEIQPVHSEGDQPWVFTGRTDAEAETPILWPPHAKSWLIGKDSDAGRDCGQEEKGTTEDEMAGWHHWLNGCESVNSGSWWWTGRPGVLRFMGLQRVGHDWVTELNWT